jgi:signal transduction histidine kinase
MKGAPVKKKMEEKARPPEQKNMDGRERLFDLFIHDLTGPLSIISTSTATLLHKAKRFGPLTDPQKKVLERILRNAHKTQTLLQEMIEILRSEEGLFQKEFFSVEMALRESLLDVLELSVPDVVEALRQAGSMKEFKQIIEPHNISIEMTEKYCKSSFCHDRKKVQQIMRNLFSNALKYRKKCMSISISGETSLLILVEDDGIGVPSGEQEAIFDRFVRLDASERPFVPGLGLGLSGVKALLEAMKGEISLVSREGVGTRFTVKIPPL